MGTAEITSSTAWITALLLGGQASLGLIRTRVFPTQGDSIRGWFLTGHTIIGLVLPPLAFAHAWSAMNLPCVRGTSAAGLWIATLALLLLVVQGLIGLSLLPPSGPHRIRPRRLHLAMGFILMALASGHALLNR